MEENTLEALRKGDGLLIIDMQNDFCPGGALPIPEGDKAVHPLNLWSKAAQCKGIPVYASRDWHPLRHISFKEQGGLWPPHCIQDSEGARFHPDLSLPADLIKITKGARFDKDQNSVFDNTGFAAQLKRDGVQRLFIGGLAQDVCVYASVLDARREGLEVVVIRDATFPVTREGGGVALSKMRQAGAAVL